MCDQQYAVQINTDYGKTIVLPCDTISYGKASTIMDRIFSVRYKTWGNTDFSHIVASVYEEFEQMKKKAKEDEEKHKEEERLRTTATIEEVFKYSRFIYPKLQRAGLKTMGELLNKTPHEVHRIKGFSKGSKGYYQLIEVLNNQGLQLKSE